MVERQEVEALLAACERDYIGPHPDNETLAALCRAWLALDGAPELVKSGKCFRIVPVEAREE